MDTVLANKLRLNLFKDFLTLQYAEDIFNELISLHFKSITNDLRTTSVKCIAFDESGFFSNSNIIIEQWTSTLFSLKEKVESVTHEYYNFALLSLYSNGQSKIFQNYESEVNFDPDSSAAILCFGATRTLFFSRNHKKCVHVSLNSGSLLEICSPTNMFWKQKIKTDPEVKDSTICITFRKILKTSEKRKSEENLPIAKHQCLDTSYVSNWLNSFFENLDALPLNFDATETMEPANFITSNDHLPQTKLQHPMTSTCPDDAILLESRTRVFPISESISVPCDNDVFQIESQLQEPLRSTSPIGQVVEAIILKKELSNLMYITCELYKSDIKVMLNQFLLNENIDSTSKRYGVQMTISTWYDFFPKILNFDLIYPTSSFVANNAILVLNNNSEMHIQDLNNMQALKVTLNENQFQILKEVIPEINDKLIKFMYTEYLPNLIMTERRPVSISLDQEYILMSRLIICIEENLLNEFEKIFQCSGCKVQHFSTIEHTCITYTNSEKFTQLGDNVLMLVNIPNVADNFINRIDFVSQNFSTNISVELIKGVLFKTYSYAVGG